jgi:hypothetical protein
MASNKTQMVVKNTGKLVIVNDVPINPYIYVTYPLPPDQYYYFYPTIQNVNPLTEITTMSPVTETMSPVTETMSPVTETMSPVTETMSPVTTNYYPQIQNNYKLCSHQSHP